LELTRPQFQSGTEKSESKTSWGCSNWQNIPPKSSLKKKLREANICLPNEGRKRDHYGQLHSFSSKSTKKKLITCNKYQYTLKVGQ